MLVVPDFIPWLVVIVLVVAAGALVLRALRNRRLEHASSLLPSLAAIAMVVGAVIVPLYTYKAVVVEDDGKGGVRAVRMVTIGEPDHPQGWVYARDPTWIINRSSRSVYLELVEYRRSVVIDPTEIMPGSVDVDQRVDYIGPDDPPPRQSKTRNPVLWLRW